MPWDQILVYLIIAAAALYLARGLFRRAKGGACGGGCHGCGPASAPEAPQAPKSELVQLDVTPRRSAPPSK